MRNEKILHIVAVAFSINYFFGKQFSYLSKKNGNEYHLGCSPSKELFSLSKELDFIPFDVTITRYISPYKDLKSILAVYLYIKKNKINKVVGHTPKGGMIAMIAASFAGVPERIYFRHGIIYETSSGLRKFILKNIDKLSGTLATKVVCVSKSIQEISIRDQLNNPRKNIVLGRGTCSGIDTIEKYNRDSYSHETVTELKIKLGIDPNDFIVGFVGRLVKDKGIDDLILAWDIVKATNKFAKLLLVGPIEERDAISAASIDKINNNSSIIFTNFVLDASIYYTVMDVFILPSYREGFPTVALEASAMGIPVLISKATGCAEAIIENETGLFISHDPSDIALKINYYFDNKNVAQSHGANGIKFVRRNFEQTIIWDIINKILLI